MLADKSEVVKSDLTLFQRNKVVDTPQNIISDTTIIIAKNQSKITKNTDKIEEEKQKLKELSPKTASTSAAIHEEFSVYKDVTYTKSSITVQNTVKNKRISVS
uniref:Uncharacterized protein n=1 Tax=Meloidogyne enterolobii TaxID=390850 RepID=A0A6V7XCE2_MELEN|nr:unnamed protein product [Meloidogyne enterolobii]